MSVDISKPADQVLADAKKDLANAFPTEADQIAASDKFEAALSDDPEVMKKACVEIKHLAQTMRNLRKEFIDVASELVGFDAADFMDKNGEIIKLGPKWAPYISQFDDALQCSLEQATDAAVLLKSMTSLFGIVGPEDAADLKRELHSFMDILKKKERDSSLVMDNFQRLADDVSLFSKEVDVLLKRNDNKIHAEFDREKKVLEGLQKNLKDIDEKIKCLSAAIVQMLAVGATAAAGTILELNPDTILIAVSSMSSCGTGIALKKAMDERHNVVHDIETKEREIVKLAEGDRLLKKYKTGFFNISAHFVDLFSRMAVILNISNAMALDMYTLAETLDDSIHDGVLSKSVSRKIQVTKRLYQHLVYLLETYVEETR